MTNLLRDCMAALPGARNPHVLKSTFRLLRSVRLALQPLATVSHGFQTQNISTLFRRLGLAPSPLRGVAEASAESASEMQQRNGWLLVQGAMPRY